MSKRLLAFSRRQLLTPKVLDINTLVKEVEPLLHRTLGEDIEIETKLGSDLWLTEVDPGQLENALLNLAINARDAMPQGGILVIETDNVSLDEFYVSSHANVKCGDYVLLRVGDNGTGISEKVLAQVFEPFFSTKKEGKGSASGLSMVYGFVKQSQGHIQIYSEDGYGTNIKIYLPRSLSAGEHLEEARYSAEDLPGGRETILLVEDDEPVRKTASTLLRSLGYKVLVAADGPAALSVLDGNEDVDRTGIVIAAKAG